MPRPETEPKTAEGHVFWRPRQDGEHIEGLLLGPTEVPGDRTYWHLQPDDSDRMRLPTDADLIGKLAEVWSESRGRQCWVRIEYGGKNDKGHHMHDVQYWPPSAGA